MIKFMRSALIAIEITIASLVVAAAVSAQGIGHTFVMRGQIVDITDGIATICVGHADGATPGQTLNVVRVTPIPRPSRGTGPITPSFRRDDIGSIKIESIVDEHFARARVMNGPIAMHDIVELRRK